MQLVKFVSLPLLFCFSFVAFGCGGIEYRTMGTITPQEKSVVSNSEFSYTKCMMKESLEIDNGNVNINLVVKESARVCNQHIESIKAYLLGAHFYPSEVDTAIQTIYSRSTTKVMDNLLSLRN